MHRYAFTIVPCVDICLPYLVLLVLLLTLMFGIFNFVVAIVMILDSKLPAPCFGKGTFVLFSDLLISLRYIYILYLDT